MINNFRFILFPFAIIYAIITEFRNWLFNHNFLKQNRFNIPIINVGNLSAGGTGKTPQIEYLIDLLSQKYNTIAVVSRGYKRKTKGFILADKNSTPKEIGDEPYQIKQKFKKIILAVSEKRVPAIQNLLELKNSPEIILLDDAFQHRYIQASLNILLTEYNKIFYNDFILPVGNLRECRKNVSRADIIIVSKSPPNLSDQEKEKIKQRISKYTKKPVFFSYISYSDKVYHSNQKISINDLKNYQILLITGIANPQHLYKFLSEKNLNFESLKYSDHYSFNVKDINKITEKFTNLKSDKKIILTTEKDYVRLKNKIKLPLFYLPVKTEIMEKETFNNKILNYDYSTK